MTLRAPDFGIIPVFADKTGAVLRGSALSVDEDGNLSGAVQTTTVNFGAFPGSPSAQVVVPAPEYGAADAVLDVWIAPIATSDHSADEHSADPPLVNAQIINGNIVINAYASGRDKPIPAGTPFGNAAGSQQPIGQQQPMPYGKWTVAWAFA